MNFTMTKIAAAAVLATAAMSAQAAAIESGVFNMYDPTGAYVGGASDITGFMDLGSMTWGVASATPFFGLTWTASGGQLFGEGTHTVSTVDAGGASGPDVTFTVGAGQIGGNINFAWGATTGIDVFNVWNVSGNTYTSTDIDNNGILGLGMVDGPFPGFSANFNVTTAVPEASTYGMMLAGLGLVGFAVRRRKLMA
jgi:hypothetical protein